jgi:hypothetical protein
MAEMVPHDYATKADLDLFKAEILQAITEMRAEMRVDLATIPGKIWRIYERNIASVFPSMRPLEALGGD